MWNYETPKGVTLCEFLNLIPQWNPTLYYKDGSWEKIRSIFTIIISIPYNPEKSIPKPGERDDILFLGIRPL